MKTIIIFYAHIPEHLPLTATFVVYDVIDVLGRARKFKKDIISMFNIDHEYSWLILNYKEYDNFHKTINDILLNEFKYNHYNDKITFLTIFVLSLLIYLL